MDSVLVTKLPIVAVVTMVKMTTMAALIVTNMSMMMRVVVITYGYVGDNNGDDGW